jgi:hypothetical protein
MKTSPQLDLHIDALILHGVPQSPGLVAAIEAELLRLLGEPGALGDLLPLTYGPAARDIARIDGGALGGGRGQLPLGVEIGRALYRLVLGLAPRDVPAVLPAASRRQEVET